MFATPPAQRATGADTEEFAGDVRCLCNAGISLSPPKSHRRANWNYRGRQGGDPVAAGASIERGTYP